MCRRAAWANLMATWRFFFSSRRRHTMSKRDWSSDVCSSDLLWMAGGGVKPGMVYGETDELGYGITEGKVSVRDLQTTILHLMGLDAHQFTYPFQGLKDRKSVV